MNFITIEHKDGAITLNADRVDSLHKSNEKYFVNITNKNCNDSYLELNKDQYDKLLKYFV